MKTIEENNILIAGFMGQREIIVNIPFSYEVGEEMPTSGNICNSILDAEEEVQTEIDEGNLTGCDVLLQTPQYHTSWDWLMPCIGKIKNTPRNHKKGYWNYIDKIDASLTEIDMEITYKAVVEFIIWHNKNK